MSGNYTDVREMSGISLEVVKMSELSGKKSCHGKLPKNLDCATFIIFHYSVAVDGTGFCDVIIMKSLSLNIKLTE